jgi:hypothetical protein
MTDLDAVSTRTLGRWLFEAGVAAVAGGLVSWLLNSLLLQVFVSGGYGLLTVFSAVPAAACSAVLVTLAVGVAAVARTRLGMRWRASRRAAAALCVAGWLPWFAPDEARFGLTPALAVGPGLLVATVWFVALAALAVDARRVRRTATALLVAVAVLWLPLRDAVVDHATAAALDGRAIPRSMAFTATWDGFRPVDYRRVGDEVRLQYELEVGFPCPDCESTGVLSIGPASDDPCHLPMALADGGSTPVQGCDQVGPQTWARLTAEDGCDVVQVRGTLTIGVYEDDCPEVSNLLQVLATARPADQAEILSRT